MKGLIGAALLAGAYGPLIVALREGLTVRGYYNPSIAATVTIATGVSQLSDVHTSGNNYLQATGGLQPAYTANDATLRARGTIAGDGVNDILTCATYDTPAPGTTPVYLFAIIKNNWTITRIIWGSTSVTQTNCGLAHNPATPQLRSNNGTATANGGLAAGSWGRVECQFTNSAADYFKLVSTNVTGTNNGNNTQAGVGRTLCNGGAGTFPSAAGIGLLLSCEGTASARFRTFANYWTTNYFGAGLV